MTMPMPIPMPLHMPMPMNNLMNPMMYPSSHNVYMAYDPISSFTAQSENNKQHQN